MAGAKRLTSNSGGLKTEQIPRTEAVYGEDTILESLAEREGNSSNPLFETLTDWEGYLKHEAPHLIEVLDELEEPAKNPVKARSKQPVPSLQRGPSR